MEVTAAYIMGIKEGRELLKANPDYTREDIQEIINNIKSTLGAGFSGDIKQMLHGELDFWTNQLKSNYSKKLAATTVLLLAADIHIATKKE